MLVLFAAYFYFVGFCYYYGMGLVRCEHLRPGKAAYAPAFPLFLQKQSRGSAHSGAPGFVLSASIRKK